MQCGFEREGDVPGWEIPDRYFAFVRSGDARPLEGVLEHNRLDILSLALVTAQTCQMLQEGPASARNPREALGLGRIYLSGGRLQEARECFADAGGLSVRPRESGSHAGEAMVQAEGLRAFALISRRARQFDDAETAWRRVLELKGTPPHIVREATDALAVHFEHRRRDLRDGEVLRAAVARVRGSRRLVRAPSAIALHASIARSNAPRPTRACCSSSTRRATRRLGAARAIPQPPDLLPFQIWIRFPGVGCIYCPTFDFRAGKSRLGPLVVSRGNPCVEEEHDADIGPGRGGTAR